MPARTYRNFFIQVSAIDPKTKQYEVRVGIGIPGGVPDFNEKESCTFDTNSFVIESRGNRVDLLDRLKSRDITPPQLYRLGEILTDLILPRSVRERLLKSLNIVRERKQCLRIRLSIEENELRLLPWEYLYLEGVGAPGQTELNFLALQHDISIVRHEAIDAPEPRLDKRDRYKLVTALASPPGQPPLNVNKERKAIEDMIAMVEKIKGTRKIDPVWVESATSTTLFDTLQSGADIFHFAGHGYFNGHSGQILLENDDHSGSTYYDATDLALLMNGVKLAVLGACESGQASGENIWGGVAQALVQAGMAAVVGSQFRLEDRNAEPLAKHLYRGVLAGDTVDESVSNARRAIRNLSGLKNRDWGALVLYLRVEDGIIFPREHLAAIDVSPIPRIAPTPLQTSLIGRDDELNTIQSNLRGSKHHFYGVYGVGKTSLATQLFTHAVEEDIFTDGYLWYRVGRGDHVSTVLEWIGAQFGDQKVAQARNANAKINALRELLAERDNLLLGLDEVDDSSLARAVIEAAGNCTVVLNGPKALGLSDKSKEHGLTPLTTDEAMRLFVSLINHSLPELDEEDQQKIREICEKMGNLPLAIKLTALKHADGESLATIQERLEIAPSTIIEGHEEVSTIFAAIYADLQKVPAALRLLVRVANFPTREAPLGPLRANEDDLEFFQAKDKAVALGLVNPTGSDRLAVHPLLGRLAQSQVDKKVTAEERNYIADWLLNYAHEYTKDYQALAREHRNLLGAFEWFDKARKPAATISLINDIFEYLRVRGYWQEARAQLDRAKQFAKTLNSTSDLAWTHLHLGIILTQQGNYNLARTNLDAAVSLYNSTNDQVGCGRTVYRLANLSFFEGHLGEALRLAQESQVLMGDKAPAQDRSGARAREAGILAAQGNVYNARARYDAALKIAEENDDLEEQAMVHSALGSLFRKAGKHEAALTEYQVASDQYKRIGHVRDIARLELEIGNVFYYQGNYDEALKHFNQALKDFELLKYKLGLALAYHALGNVAYSQAGSEDDLGVAEQEYQKALAINRDDLRAALGVARNHYQLAVIAQRRGHDHEAKAVYLEVETVARREKDLSLLAGTLHQLGRIDLAAGNLKDASSRANQALEFARQAEDRLAEVSALTLIGSIAARQGNQSEARKKLLTAQAAFRDLNAPEALKVGKLLEELERGLSSPPAQVEKQISHSDYINIILFDDDGNSYRDIDVILDAGVAEAIEPESEEESDDYVGIDVITNASDPPHGGGGGGRI